VSPVSEPELISLASSPDIISLGMLADEARRARHGVRTTFVRVADVPIAGRDAPDWPAAAGELRLTGTPDTLTAALARVRQVAATARDVPLSGFSLADLEELAGRESITLRSVLEQLRQAGLELIAEAPVDRLRDARRAIEEVNIAGLALARLTVQQWPAAGGREGVDAIQELFKRVNALQRDVAVIRSFAPLPRKVNPAAPTTGYDDIKRVALARLFVDSVPSIQVDWSLYGPKLAQVALTVGADDLDAVSPADDLSQGVRRSPVEEVRRNIRAAGLEPVERGGRFDPIARPA
jgi:aminodeoxyfutalosine synthase